MLKTRFKIGMQFFADPLKPEEMNLTQVIARLAELDEIVRKATKAEDIDNAAAEKTKLLARKAELESIEQRRQTALGLTAGTVTGTTIDQRNENKPKEETDIYATPEYRKAFMTYCRTGVMGAEYRLDAFTSTVEAAALIPTTVMTEIVKKLESYGSLFQKVRKLNIAGGVNFPILSLKPTATWITEATPSDRKNATLNTSVSFSYFGLECKIATSLLVNTVILSAFESTFADLAVEAIVKAIDISIINGVGATQPLGIINDPRVPAAQIITLSAADFTTWDGWKKKVFAKIPLSYRAGGSWIMAAGTFDGYIDGMVDANGQPIARINYGIADAAQERFGGREVLLVEEDVIKSYDAAAVADVVAVFAKLSDYGFNSNMQMGVYRWLDQDKNQWVDKVLLIGDGKLIDPNGVVIVKKGA